MCSDGYVDKLSLQISFMNLFVDFIPDFSPKGANTPLHFGLQIAVLAAALVCTGIGAAMSLNMRIVPNPGDGIVQAIADCIHQSVGNTKNGFDLCKGEDGSGSRG